ncbi:hypothetical protein NDI49_26045 [Trichocoleus sp. ST-U3]
MTSYPQLPLSRRFTASGRGNRNYSTADSPAPTQSMFEVIWMLRSH